MTCFGRIIHHTFAFRTTFGKTGSRPNYFIDLDRSCWFPSEEVNQSNNTTQESRTLPTKPSETKENNNFGLHADAQILRRTITSLFFL